MTDTKDLNQEEIENILIEINGKLENFSLILQNFGLDLITKLGKNESKLTMLTDKIENLAKATLDIKAFTPILNKIVDRQKSIESELDLLKSLIQQSLQMRKTGKLNESLIKRDESITNNFELIKQNFENFKEEIDKIEQTEKAKEILIKIREDIFELTGGHRILYEIAQVIKLLEDKIPFDDELKTILRDKIGFWMNKLK
ncbi:MAG: hypothetical protein ACFFBP_05435 [Promethearchaeota archaeon]